MRMLSSQARELFAAARVVRLATVTAAGAPHLVPVTAAVLPDGGDDLIVFAIDHKPKSSAALRRLDNIAGEPRVSFLADHYDDDWDRLWWVRADATATVLTAGEATTALDALAAKYSQYRDHRPDGAVVVARVRRWTGWAATGPRPQQDSSEPDVPPTDDKDWTWTIDRPCPDCGFDPAAVAPTALPAALLAVADRWEAVLLRPGVRDRPAPTTWSPLEYAAHVRDVYTIFGDRARLILDQNEPTFANWDQDETALQKRYWTGDPAVVGEELADAAEAAAEVFAAVPSAGWDRVGRRSNGSVFTVRTLGSYFLHDLEHHLHDVAG